MSKKIVYTCDICGNDFNNKKHWTLECETFFTSEYSLNKKIVMDICEDCVKELKHARKKSNYNQKNQ